MELRMFRQSNSCTTRYARPPEQPTHAGHGRAQQRAGASFVPQAMRTCVVGEGAVAGDWGDILEVVGFWGDP